MRDEYKVEPKYTVVSDTGTFAMVPTWVLHSKLSATALRVYAVLALHADNTTRKTFQLRSSLAKECGCSVRTVARALADLSEAGAIRVKNRTGEGGMLVSSLFTIYRRKARKVSLGKDKNVPTPRTPVAQITRPHITRPQSSEDFSEEKSSSSSAAAADEDETLSFLDSLQDLYSSLPSGFRSPIVKPAAFFESVRQNGNTIPRFAPATVLRAAELVKYALYRDRPKQVVFPHPRDVAGLDALLSIIEQHPKLRTVRERDLEKFYVFLSMSVREFLCRDDEDLSGEVNPVTVLTRLAKNPEILRQVVNDGS